MIELKAVMLAIVVVGESITRLVIAITPLLLVAKWVGKIQHLRGLSDDAVVITGRRDTD